MRSPGRQHRVWRKVREWFYRYGPAEATGITTLILGGITANTVFAGSILAAYLTAWSESAGYFGNLFVRDMLRQRRKYRSKPFFWKTVHVLRNMSVEFGIAEYLDELFIRPFAMYTFPKLTGNVMVGIIIGKLFADSIFYLPTIVMYEFRKVVFHD